MCSSAVLASFFCYLLPILLLHSFFCYPIPIIVFNSFLSLVYHHLEYIFYIPTGTSAADVASDEFPDGSIYPDSRWKLHLKSSKLEPNMHLISPSTLADFAALSKEVVTSFLIFSFISASIALNLEDTYFHFTVLRQSGKGVVRSR